MTNWRKPFPGADNVILQGKGFFISYNPRAGAPSPAADPTGIGMFAQAMGGMINGEVQPQEETALTTNRPNARWRILKGDFRGEYEAALPGGFQACLEVYNRYKENRSEWSTDHDLN